jgi:hypothetical protein
VSTSVWTSLPATLPGPRASGRTAEVDRAILRTVLYASLFQAPLSLAELHRSLMDVGVDRLEIRARLARAFLRERVEVAGDRVYLRGREACLDLQRERRERTRRLLRRHRLLLRAVARVPFVRLVALSGACAHDNATASGVDLFLVARRGRAWSVFLVVALLARVFGRRRTLSLNYVVDEDGQALPERDLFTAAEIVGLRPLSGGAAYLRFVEANAWVAERFPNFFWTRKEVVRTRAAGAPWLERLLDAFPAPALEALARRVLGARFLRRWDGAAGVVLSPHRLKLHPIDHGPGLRAAFSEVVERADADEYD